LYASSKVAISKFEQDTPLPYDKIQKNLEIVKKHITRPLTLAGTFPLIRTLI